MKCEHEVRRRGWFMRRDKCGKKLEYDLEYVEVTPRGRTTWHIYRCERRHETRILVKVKP